MPTQKLLYIINVDWYFMLHWLDRGVAAMEAGYEVHVAMGETDKKHRLRLEGSGFIVHIIRLNRKTVNPFPEVFTAYSIYRLIKQQKPDIVHSVTIKPNIYVGIVCRLLFARSIASVTGLGTIFSNGIKGEKIVALYGVKGLYKMAFGGSRSLVLFENMDDLAVMIDGEMIRSEQGIHIHGAGVDTSLYFEREAPPDSPVKVLFAARLLTAKGLHGLVEVIRQLKHEGAGVDLLVAGIVDTDARDTIRVEQLEQWQASGDIQWLGTVTAMPLLIGSVHIVCLPTQYGEGVPRILIEGAACGRPLVATDVQGCREIIRHGKNGLLVMPGSQKELKAALYRLINEPETRKAMGEKGRLLVENEYSSSIVIRKTMEVYQKSLSL